jgi:hypothetical protein
VLEFPGVAKLGVSMRELLKEVLPVLYFLLTLILIAGAIVVGLQAYSNDPIQTDAPFEVKVR